MARDYEDIDDVDTLTDRELRELVLDRFGDRDDIDISGLELAVTEGRVRVAGRVGSEAERQIIEHVLTDVIGVRDVANELVVDDLVRAEQPEAADEANAQLYASQGGARGGADRTEDSAEHMLEDTAAEQYGTSDVGEAIERGHSYNPPDGPVQEGNWNREDH
jgi:hypothetical protein